MSKRPANTRSRSSKRARAGSNTSSAPPPNIRQVSHYIGKLQFDEDDLVKLQEPLKGTWMHLKMYAVTTTGDKSLTLDDAFPLKVTLLCDGGMTEVDETHQTEGGLPALECKSMEMTKEGTATIQLKINVLSRHFHSSDGFQLRVQPAMDAQVSGLEEVQTPPFHVVSQRLKVTDLGNIRILFLKLSFFFLFSSFLLFFSSLLSSLLFFHNNLLLHVVK